MLTTSDLDELGNFRGLDGRGWICDSCGNIIDKATDGWIQWRDFHAESKERKRLGQHPLCRDLQLVHHAPASPRRVDHVRYFGCQFNDQDPTYGVKDLPLTFFLGPDGLMKMLAFIAEEDVERNEVLEMIKRLFIVGYEHARLHFSEAISDGVFEPNTAPGYHSHSDIEAVNVWRENRSE